MFKQFYCLKNACIKIAKNMCTYKKGAISTKMSICESKSTSLSELLRRSVAIVSHFTRGVGATCGSVFNW